MQLVGRKRVLLWPPEAREQLQAPPVNSPLANTSPHNPFAPSSLGPPEAVDETAICLCSVGGCVVLKPGDALLIPKGWWHHVCSLTTSFSVSYWW